MTRSGIFYTPARKTAPCECTIRRQGIDAPRRVVEVNDIAQLAGRGISSGSSYYGNGSRRSMYNGGGNSMFENRSPSYGGSRGGYGSPRYGDYRSPSSSGLVRARFANNRGEEESGKAGAHCHRFHSGIRERDFSRRVRRRATRVFDCVAVAVELRKLLPIVVSPCSNGSSNSSGSRYITPTRLSVVETRDPPPSGGSSARGLTSARALLDASANALRSRRALLQRCFALIRQQFARRV